MLKEETHTNLWGYSAILCVWGGSEDNLWGSIFSFHHVGLQMLDLEASTLPCSAVSLAHRKRSLDMSIWEKQKQKNPCFSQQANPETEFLFPVMFSLCSNYFRILTILTAFFFYFFCSPEDMCFPLLDFISSYTSKVRVEVEELLNHSYVWVKYGEKSIGKVDHNCLKAKP